MDIISENVFDSSIEKVKQMMSEAIERLVEYKDKIGDGMKKEFLPLLGDLVKNFTGEMKGIALGKEVDILDMSTLVSFAKKYIVPKSNEIVAMKIKQDDSCFVYLTYSKDRQLLPISDNKYVIIKALTLSPEVEELFKESELIILK